MTDLRLMGEMAKKAAYELEGCTCKEAALYAIADALEEKADYILAQNNKDLQSAEGNGVPKPMLDRLKLTEDRIRAMADGVRKVADLDDPIGEVKRMWKRPNGIVIGEKRVPLGVVAIIYEARPNVTADAAALCLKTSNSVILRGGKEAINSNLAIMKVMQEAAYGAGVPEGSLNIIDDTSRETATALMKLSEYVDVLIPRGGKGLIKSVVENATVPVIETAAGNCHVYVEKTADAQMAKDILINAKVSRPSVCNACETVLIDRDFPHITMLIDALVEKGVEVRVCESAAKLYPNLPLASEADWYEEYNDYIIALKLVDGIDEAINHINKYNTKHSEAIITKDYELSQKFLSRIDAAAVYVNASTRFTDGFEFGFGAEIGISTQKIHARGPMGLEALTSYKYIVYGNGQVR